MERIGEKGGRALPSLLSTPTTGAKPPRLDILGFQYKVIESVCIASLLQPLRGKILGAWSEAESADQETVREPGERA